MPLRSFRILFAATLCLSTPAFAALEDTPKEDVHDLAEHAPEAIQDARYLTLPWSADRLVPRKWQTTFQAGAAQSEASFYKFQGPMVAFSVGTGLNARWGVEVMAFYGSMNVSGGSKIELLSASFLQGVPLDLPEWAEFSNPSGEYLHWGMGGSLVHEFSSTTSERRWTMKLGLLYDHLEIAHFESDYRMVSGASVGTQGILDHSSRADFLTPYFGLQRTIPLGNSWILAPRLVAGAPLPPGDFDERLTGPGFDISTARAGEGTAGKIGDAYFGLSAGLINRRSGLEIDVGATLFFPLLENKSHPGVNKALLIQVAWHLH